MIDQQVRDDLLAELSQMTPVARTLTHSLVPGTDEMLRFAGLIDHDDLESMRQVIEDEGG